MEDDNVTNLDDHRKEIEALKAELLVHGVIPTEPVKLSRLKELVQYLRDTRKGKPPCFKRSWGKMAMQCRLCDLQYECSSEEEILAEIPISELVQEACEKCKQGMLIVECMNEVTGVVQDYACDNEGCINTLVQQTGYILPEEEEKVEPPPKPIVRRATKKELKENNTRRKKKPKRQAEQVSLNDMLKPHPRSTGDRAPRTYVRMDKGIIRALEEAETGIIRSQKLIHEVVRGDRNKIYSRIKALTENGTLTYKHGVGYSIKTIT